jgi:hypothetical protein
VGQCVLEWSTRLGFTTVSQLLVCWCGAHSLTRGWVCSLQLLLGLVSAVILGYESRGTRNHILLSQIRDFPFRLLLRLADIRPHLYTGFPFYVQLPKQFILRGRQFILFLVRYIAHLWQNPTAPHENCVFILVMHYPEFCNWNWGNYVNLYVVWSNTKSFELSLLLGYSRLQYLWGYVMGCVGNLTEESPVWSTRSPGQRL